MGPPTPFGLQSSPCPPPSPRFLVPMAPCSRCPKAPCSHGSVLPCIYIPCTPAPCTQHHAPLHPSTMHPCYHAPMHHATLLPCTVDAWVISHRHHDTMTHTHPCRSTTGLTATLTPVIHQPTSHISLLTPHQGSLLPFKPLYHRNHTNTHPMHPKHPLAQQGLWT